MTMHICNLLHLKKKKTSSLNFKLSIFQERLCSENCVKYVIHFTIKHCYSKYLLLAFQWKRVWPLRSYGPETPHSHYAECVHSHQMSAVISHIRSLLGAFGRYSPSPQNTIVEVESADLFGHGGETKGLR